MWLLLMIILLILLIGAVPAWPYARGWGYGPAGILGLLLVVLLFLMLFGVINVGWNTTAPPP